MPEKKFSPLGHGDFAVPSILYGSSLVGVPLPDGALPASGEASALDVYRGLERDELPIWADQYTDSEVLELAGLLAEFLPPGSDKVYAFDAMHRLEPYTMVGQPVGTKLPVLTFKRESEHWESFRYGVLSLLRDLKTDPRTEPARRLIDVDLVAAKELTRRLEPGEIQIAQSWRLLSTFSHYVVGNPAGTVTLTPGENREVTFKLTRSRTVKTAQKSVAIESSTSESADSFNVEFQRQTKNTSSGSQSIQWGRDSTKTYADSVYKTTESGSEGESIERLADRVEKTTRQLSEKQTAKREVTLTNEYELTDQETSEGTRKANLVNDNRALTVTYAYHHLNAVYRVHMELMDVSLLVSSVASAGAPRSLALNAGIRAAIEGVVAGDHIDECVARIKTVLETMLDGTGAIEDLADDLAIRSDEPDNPNLDVTARGTLLGDRQNKGPLPVCVKSFTQVLQTSQLHAIPHVSETSADDGTNPGKDA